MAPSPLRQGNEGIAGLGIYHPIGNTQHAYRLLGRQNILHAEPTTIYVALYLTKDNMTHSYIVMENLNPIYLIHNHLRQPFSYTTTHTNYPYKL